MPEFQVKKVVAVCFLEAVKLSLEHIGAHRLEMSQQGVAGPDNLPRMYGDIRRLRDYLQRCVSAYDDVVDLDLADVDASLLVACCRRAVESIENRLDMGAGLKNEREWMIKKRTVLSDWAVEIAAKPLIELPLARIGQRKGEAERALDTRLLNKVFGDVNQRKKIVPPSSKGGSLATGIASFGDAMNAVSFDESKQDEQEGDGDGDVSGYGLRDEAPSAPPPAERKPAAPQLLDRRRIRDPRLRSLIGVDLGSFQRCVADGDHRLATVLLASVVEAAVIDHAIPRRGEFGLSGTPDTWAPQDLLLRVMGDAAQPKDRAQAFHLFASRNLLRPSLQMVTPAVVTQASFEQLLEFAGRALHAMGFGAPAKTAPPGAVEAEDLPQA